MKVLIADDHGIVREGLRSLIEKQPDLEVIAEADDGLTAAQLTEELKPDLVIMDVTMPDLNGIEATRRIIDKTPGTKVLALSIHSTRRFVLDMLKVGVSGYVLKSCLFDDLVQAIRTVMADEVYLSPRVTSVVINDYINTVPFDNIPTSSVLTERERLVTQLLAEGKSTREIALRLHVSAKTIDANRRHIMDKLNIHSMAKLTKYAIRNGLTSLEF